MGSDLAGGDERVVVVPVLGDAPSAPPGDDAKAAAQDIVKDLAGGSRPARERVGQAKDGWINLREHRLHGCGFVLDRAFEDVVRDGHWQ
jgi:hypothetical protein